MHNIGVICFNNLAKLLLSVSQSLLTQEFWNMESLESLESLESPDSIGPRCALKIVALRAKIGSVVPTALIFIFALAR